MELTNYFGMFNVSDGRERFTSAINGGHYDFRADTEADFLRGCYS